MKRFAALPLAFLLMSCAALDFRPGALGDSGGSIVNRSAAERACVAQAGEQMLEIVHVVATRPVAGSGGVIVGRDVTLQVRRGGDSYEVRCSYTNDTGEARIMSL